MKQKGRITQWNDHKGLGFIEVAGRADELFFHISDVASDGVRPVLGDSVIYRQGLDKRGRPFAVDVVCERAATRVVSEELPSRFYAGTEAAAWVAAIFLVGLFLSALLGFSRMPLAVWYLALSAVAYAMYIGDKNAAQAGRWRTPEKTLHLMGLLGGWPGAWIARVRKRHKTKKVSFRIVFWLSVVANLAAFYWLHSAEGAVWLDQLIETALGGASRSASL